MSTVKATNFQNTSSSTVNMVTDASGNVSFGNAVTVAGNTTITGSLVPSSSYLRNRIINGDMRVDQRNAGASITASGAYALDRWVTHENTDGTYTVQQVTTAPTGYTNSLKATVTLADTSIGASQNAMIAQYIEGYNVADLGYGTATAQTVTLSFWVNSSLTGTFTGALNNSAYDRSYPFTYTISVANTWEQKSVTIAGDTSGTWLTTNGVGIRVWFALAAGSSVITTAGAWAAGTFYGATGQANWMATLSNTFYVTGVQLEVGTVATPFERQLYNAQLSQCQRYYERIGAYGSTSAWTTITNPVSPKVSKRTTPTITMTDISGGANAVFTWGGTANDLGNGAAYQTTANTAFTSLTVVMSAEL